MNFICSEIPENIGDKQSIKTLKTMYKLQQMSLNRNKNRFKLVFVLHLAEMVKIQY